MIVPIAFMLPSMTFVNGQQIPEEVPWQQQKIVRFRQGPLQGIAVSAGFVGDSGSDALTIADYEALVRLAIPLGSFQNVLVVTPSFRQHVIDAPASVDLPNSVYETGLSFFYRKQITERFTLLSTVAPSVRSDFKTDDDGIRIFGLGLIVWDWVPDVLQFSFGAVYLDRDDIPLLPAIGIDWSPTPDWKLELRFPRPRLLRRLAKNGPISETWAFAAFSLGGNTFAVRRANGIDDELTLRDFRAVLGVEQIREGGRGYFVEAGLAFGRSMEYQSGDEQEFDPGGFVAAGWTF